MKLLQRLTMKNLRLNKKRTIMTILGICLSVALITSVFTMLASFRTSMINYQISTDGDAHYYFYDVPGEEMKYFSNNRSIEKWFYTQGIGFAELAESKNEYKPYAYLLATDSDSFESLALHLIEGRFPQTEEEIVIPRHLKTNGRIDYHVGDSLTLDVGQRYDEDGNIQTTNTGLLENEKLTTEFRKTYKIVGIIERPGYGMEDYYAAGYTFVTWTERQEQDWKGLYTVYAKYTKKALRNHYEVTANLLGVDVDFFEETQGGVLGKSAEQLEEGMKNAKFRCAKNNTLINLETFNLDEGILAIFSLAAIIALLLIILSSVFCIHNSFEISITEKIRQYGMLASVGATKKQIRKNVLYEALVLGIIGTPLGILLGLFASVLLTRISDVLLLDFMDGITMQFSFSLAAICSAALLGALTIYLSTVRAARRAAKISPISAIRSNEDILIRSKKMKDPRIIKKIFGMGGTISYKNMKRNRKKYRTIVTSIVICISVFIGLSSFVQFAFSVVESEYPTKDCNLSVSVYTSGKLENQESAGIETAMQEICNQEETERYTIQKHEIFTIASPDFTEEAKEKIVFYDEDGVVHQEPPETIDLNFLSLGDEEYRRYVKSLGLSYDQAEKKAILLNTMVTHFDKKATIRLYNYKKGDTLMGITGKYSEGNQGTQEMELTLAAVTDKIPLGVDISKLEYSLYRYGFLIVSDALIDEIQAQYPEDSRVCNIYIKSSHPDKQQDEIENIIETSIAQIPSAEFNLLNLDYGMRQEQSLIILISIFLYGFISVIALIGITSIFNTITASMNLRSREFAMLRSVGMTKREFNQMVGLESVFYGIKSLVIAIPLGMAFSLLIYRAFYNDLLEIKYVPPVGALLISVFIVFLLLLCIMRYSLRRINQQEIIETIRKDDM